MTTAEQQLTCNFDDCHRPADVWLNVQWSLFDFMDIYACKRHFERAVDWASVRKVDGMLPIDMQAHWFRE